MNSISPEEEFFVVFEELAHVRDVEQIAEIHRRVGGMLGFEWGSVTQVVGSRFTDLALNIPSSYRDLYSSVEQGRRDPVMQFVKTNSAPIAWDGAVYLVAGAASMYEEMAGKGVKAGVCVALHLPSDRHLIVGFERATALPGERADRLKLLSRLQLLLLYLQAATDRLGVVPAHDLPMLTPREEDVLRWSACGKNAWEIGKLLNINEATVLRHVQSAGSKLGTRERHATAARALGMGLITL